MPSTVIQHGNGSLNAMELIHVAVALSLTVDTENTHDRMEPYILNGNRAKKGQFPFTAVISGGCSGSLIGKKTVITAAHCEKLINTVTVGEITEGVGTAIKIKKMKRNPSFKDDGLGPDDLLMLQLETPPTKGQIIQLNCQYIPSGTKITVAGFGNREEDEDTKKTGELFYEENTVKDCGQEYFSGGICQEVNSNSPFEGDSGGPMLLYDKANGYTLGGVVSGGDPGYIATFGYLGYKQNCKFVKDTLAEFEKS